MINESAMITDMDSRSTDQPDAGGTTVSTDVTWAFFGGALGGEPVLPLLRRYLDDLGALLREAETRLSQG